MPVLPHVRHCGRGIVPSHCPIASWPRVTVALHHRGIVVLLRRGLASSWCRGIVVSRRVTVALSHSVVASHCRGVVALWYPIMSLWPCVTVASSHHVVLSHHGLASSWCCSVVASHCIVASSRPRGVVVSLCRCQSCKPVSSL
jgi:hypothetical protein